MKLRVDCILPEPDEGLELDVKVGCLKVSHRDSLCRCDLGLSSSSGALLQGILEVQLDVFNQDGAV